jgi:uncharacterized protein YebE (UPF0316 family)
MPDVMLFSSPWLAAFSIFFLRVTDMALDTLRVLYVMRGRRAITWVLGFLQSAVFVIAITSVLSNLNNPLNIIGYAAGFATGNVIGMIIEEKLAIGFTLIQIVSSRRGVVLAQGLRDNGFAVTEVPARGKDGMVSLLNLSVRRKQVFAVEKIVNEFDEGAFMTVEEVRPMRRGFWRA